MEEREEMQDVGRCATWEKLNEEKRVCEKYKEKLEGEHRETERREYKKWVSDKTEMKNSKRHSWEKQKSAEGLSHYPKRKSLEISF